jgi:uncharacterized repeat protein (TIGR03803 family)
MKKLLLYSLLALCMTANAQFTKLFDFTAATGGAPLCTVISDGTFLYGTTSNIGSSGAGTIFKIKPDGTGCVNLFDFTAASSGSTPKAALYSDGTFLYGTTTMGGANNKGTIFKIKSDGTGFAKLLDFSGSADGEGPRARFVSDGTYLYGTATGGGTNNAGTIFKIKPDGTGFTKLHDFNTSSGGIVPEGLYYDGTFLYGTTKLDVANQNGGTIFKIKPDGTGYIKIHDFVPAVGSAPFSSLISDGTFLYGMHTDNGLIAGNVFKIKPDGTAYTSLVNFSVTPVAGGTPWGGLTLAGSDLYGMTVYGGGPMGFGALFKVKTDGTNFTKLVDFDNNTGAAPGGSLFYDGTTFYGLTSYYGANMKGTLFKFVDPSTGIAQVQNGVVEFSTYPNPADDSMIINTGTIDEQIVQLFDMCGKCLMNKSIKGQTRIETLDLKEGVYTLSLRSENRLSVKKIVVVH